MFPFEIEGYDEEIIEETEDIPKDYEIDFSTGKLTGKIISGLPAIKQWIMLVFLTDRYYFPQYSWQYGHELQSLIGKGYKRDYLETEIQRIVNSALATTEHITSVEYLNFEIKNEKIRVWIKIVTPYGNEEIDV